MRPALRGAIACAALLLAASSRGETRVATAAPFSSGGQQYSLLAGYVWGMPMFGNHIDSENRTRMLGGFGRFGIGLSDPLARGAFYEGNVEFDVEPMALVNFEPRSGWAAGGSLLLHYNFLGAGSIVPFIEGGGGGSYLDFELRDQDDGFAFPLQASLGLHALAFPRGAVTASVGYFHLSNAGTHYPNYGINTVLVRLGLTFFP